MMQRWLATLSTPVAALVLMTGCGGGSSNGSTTADEPAAASSSPSATGAPTTETAAPLTTERGGTETALPTQDGGIAISVAGLPAGGEAQDEEHTEQCVSVRYMGADEDQDLRIPGGSRLTVTGGSFRLSPDQDYDGDGDQPEAPPVRIGGSACGSQEPLCLSGFAFTPQNDEADVGCFIPVRATQGPADGDHGNTVTVVAVDFAINGELTCGGMPEEECTAFGRAAEAVADSISIRVPFVASSSSSSSSSFSPSSSYGSQSPGTSTSQG